MRTPPAPKEIRLTIPVSPEVHQAFVRIAQASKMPVGRAMGEWLADTLDAAQFMAETMEKARSAPKLVAQELHAYALGIGDHTKDLLDELRKGAVADRGGPAAAGGAGRTLRALPLTTPPSNTGVTKTTTKTRKGGTDGKNPR